MANLHYQQLLRLTVARMALVQRVQQDWQLLQVQEQALRQNLRVQHRHLRWQDRFAAHRKRGYC